MKEETKRYSLIEYCGTQIRYVKSLQEYYQIIEMMNKFNNRKTSKFFYGNALCKEDDNGLYRVTFNVYNKLTDKMTISDIDSLTSQYENEFDLIKIFKEKLVTKEGYKPDIHIMYFENKNTKDKTSDDYDRRIKYLPILFKKDKANLNKEYIEKVFYQEAKDGNIYFFKELLNEFCFNPIIGEEIEKIRRNIALAEAERSDIIRAEYFAYINYFSKQLFNKIIRERDSKHNVDRDINQKSTISMRRLRDFYVFTKNYDVPFEFRISPAKYNQKLNEYQKLVLFETEQKEEEKQKEKALKR